MVSERGDGACGFARSARHESHGSTRNTNKPRECRHGREARASRRPIAPARFHPSWTASHVGHRHPSGDPARLDPVRGLRYKDVSVRAVRAPSNRGAVAQLGERLTGSQEVNGSIPFSSTIFAKRATPAGTPAGVVVFGPGWNARGGLVRGRRARPRWLVPGERPERRSETPREPWPPGSSRVRKASPARPGATTGYRGPR